MQTQHLCVLIHIRIVFVCYKVLSVPYRLVINYWERSDLLALLSVMFSCDFVTFPYGISGQVLDCIDS